MHWFQILLLIQNDHKMNSLPWLDYNMKNFQILGGCHFLILIWMAWGHKLFNFKGFFIIGKRRHGFQSKMIWILFCPLIKHLLHQEFFWFIGTWTFTSRGCLWIFGSKSRLPWQRCQICCYLWKFYKGNSYEGLLWRKISWNPCKSWTIFPWQR